MWTTENRPRYNRDKLRAQKRSVFAENRSTGGEARVMQSRMATQIFFLFAEEDKSCRLSYDALPSVQGAEPEPLRR